MSEFHRELPPEHFANLYGSAFYSFKQYPERVQRGFGAESNEIEESLHYKADKYLTIFLRQCYPSSPEDPLAPNPLNAGISLQSEGSYGEESAAEFVTGHEVKIEIHSPFFGVKRIRSYLNNAFDVDTDLSLDIVTAEQLTKIIDATEPTPLGSKSD